MKKKENKVGLIVLILSIIVSILSFSYAIYTVLHRGEKENTMSTATLILSLEDKTSSISLINAVPISDANGLSLTPYEFTLRNSGTADALYKIYMEDNEESYREHGCENSKLGSNNIRYAITDDKGITNMNLLSTNSGLIYSGVIKASSSNNYSLRLWIKSEATNETMLKHFHGRLRVEAIQND